MEAKVNYYVILSLDIPKGVGRKITLPQAKPDIVKYPKFVITETKVEDRSWCATHRKYVGVLSPEETIRFLDDNFSDACKTMGSITELGWLPAISFSNGEDDLYYLNAYVSPILDEEDEKNLADALKKHPQSEMMRKVISDKLEKILADLEEFKVEESIQVDTLQTFLNFKEERQ